MKTVPILKPSFSSDLIEADTVELVPEDDVTARSIIISINYLLRMEQLVLTETQKEELKSLRYNILRQKQHILNIWKRMENPSRVQALADETNKEVVEAVRVRLSRELEKQEKFF